VKLEGIIGLRPFAPLRSQRSGSELGSVGSPISSLFQPYGDADARPWLAAGGPKGAADIETANLLGMRGHLRACYLSSQGTAYLSSSETKGLRPSK